MQPPESRFGTINLQDRDLALLRGLFESRVMSAGHIATLYFDGSREAAKKRLQKLKAAGLLGERTRKAYEPAILFLTRKALVLLKERGVLAEYPKLDPSSADKRARVSDITIHHELEVMDVKAAFHSAIRQTKPFTVAEFSTWPLLHQFEARRSGYGRSEVTVKPDGFVRIHENESDGGLSEHTFFLEVDRSTETLDTLVARGGYYLDYYKSGGFAERNGAARSAYKEYPFRVLMVFKTAERRNNTAERLLHNNPPILTHVWLTTFKEVTEQPLEEIWVRPVDYRHTLTGSSFDPVRQTDWNKYRRQSGREALVESKLAKCRLLNE